MSRRWFILAFSIAFLFVFRTWINEVSDSEKYRVGIIDSGDNNQLLIYPANSSSSVNLDGAFDPVSKLQRSSESQYIELLENNNELLYIFPIFPDTLSFNVHDVIVNYDTRINSANHVFRFSDY
jgi:hypothetical protein